jgi:hypothetical protein
MTIVCMEEPHVPRSRLELTELLRLRVIYGEHCIVARNTIVHRYHLVPDRWSQRVLHVIIHGVRYIHINLDTFVVDPCTVYRAPHHLPSAVLYLRQNGYKSHLKGCI